MKTMRYYTTENKLTNNGSYSARVLANRTYTEDELIEKMLRNCSIISESDLRGVMSALKETIVEIVEEGSNLSLSWLKLGYSMECRFEGAKAVREPNKHPLTISLDAGELLTSILERVRLEHILTPDFGPQVISFIDAVSRTTKSVATPGGTFKVTGERLRIGGRRSKDVGFYLRAEDGTETKVEVLIDNDPGLIIGQLPNTLATGNYKLVVKTQIGTSGQYINEVRTGTSSFTLTVK